MTLTGRFRREATASTAGGSPGVAATGNRRFVSIGTKLAGVTVLLLALVAGGVFVEISQNQRAHLLQSKELATRMVAGLFGAGATASLTFGDDRGAQEQVSLLAANDQVVYGALWSVDQADSSHALAKVGEMRRRWFASEPRPSVHPDLRISRGSDWILAETAVVDPTGKQVGIAQVALSLADENEAIHASERGTLVASLATALGLALVLVLLTRTLIVRPIERLADAAKRMEEGESVQVATDSNDEVGKLARAFDAMSRAIANREQRISERNRDLRRVLDNAVDGFLTVDLQGVMSDERSGVLDLWFGPPTAPRAFFDYIEQIAPAIGAGVRLGWEELREDVAPMELVFHQLPHHFERESRFFEIDYRPIGAGVQLEQVLVVVRDVTQQIERARAERSERETIAIVQRMLGDRAGFDNFFQEASVLVSAIVVDAGADLVRLLRDVHTLKGNCSLFGIESVAVFCHDLEQRLAEDADSYRDTDRARLRALWAATSAVYELLGGATPARGIEIDAEEYTSLIQAINSRTDHATLASIVAGWRYDRVSTRLARAAEQLRDLSIRLNKGEVAVRCEVTPPTLRLSHRRWAPFWSAFTHVLRNTMDHGVESPAERVACGKTVPAQIALAIRAGNGGVEVTIADDGRGIDWEKIRVRAADLGLPHATAVELEEALYADGVSSRQAVTEVSGRGIGMGALRETVRALGGSIEIETTLGQGTRFRFLLPPTMLPGGTSTFTDLSASGDERWRVVPDRPPTVAGAT